MRDETVQNLMNVVFEHEVLLNRLVEQDVPQAQTVLKNFLRRKETILELIERGDENSVDFFGNVENLIPNSKDLDGSGFVPTPEYEKSAQTVSLCADKILRYLYKKLYNITVR